MKDVVVFKDNCYSFTKNPNRTVVFEDLEYIGALRKIPVLAHTITINKTGKKYKPVLTNILLGLVDILNDIEHLTIIPAQAGTFMVLGKNYTDGWVELGYNYPDATNPDWVLKQTIQMNESYDKYAMGLERETREKYGKVGSE